MKEAAAREKREVPVRKTVLAPDCIRENLERVSSLSRGIPGIVAVVAFALAGRAAPTNGPAVHVLVPGFSVAELPVRLSNQNNLRFAPDGSLTALGYDGRVWTIRDTDGDGLEDTATPFWDRPTLGVPVGMEWTSSGLLVSSHGKVSRLVDRDGDGKADAEEIVASGWPATDVASGGVDATAVTLDAEGNVYFGLLVADYSNAYRLRKRRELKPDEVAWLKAQGRATDGDPEETVSLYDPASPRGTLQRRDAKTGVLSTVATGIRVPYALAFNAAGDLFNTDQEGETWMPNGNPLDELNHIVVGHNYGFPPRHDVWLPRMESDAPVVGFGPQHQSACGMVFNDPLPASRPAAAGLPATPGRGRFGPERWRGDAFVAGESRGKIWRVHLERTAGGYVGRAVLFARLDLMPTDVAISPAGDLYVCCHGGQPDWGTGPQGAGKIFRIRHSDRTAPLPIAAFASGPTEVRVAFDHPLDRSIAKATGADAPSIEFGEYVRAADRMEILKPPYAVVGQQGATPRGRLEVLGSRLSDDGLTLLIETAPHPFDTWYAVTIPGVKAAGVEGAGSTVDVDYDLSRSTMAATEPARNWTLAGWEERPSWAPRARPSSGTASRPGTAAGDWEDGRGLFFGEKLQCARCHRIRGEGGQIGPDLSNLIHRDEASVLRDVRDPGATLHPDYVTHEAVLKDGRSLLGFVRSGIGEQLKMVDAEGKEVVVARAEVTSLRPTGLSLMPTGLLEGLKEEQVLNLMTFLTRAPVARTRAEFERFRPATPPPVDGKPMSIVLVASKQDHGPGQHDYPAWQAKWRRLLAGIPGTRVETAWEWPDAAQFAGADVLVFYCWNHDWSEARLAQVDAFQRRGGGMALIHAAVIADQRPEDLALRIGLAAQPGRVGYRHMPFELNFAKDNPLTRGLPASLPFLDEPYWPMVGDVGGVSVLASAEVDGKPRPLVWTTTRGSGRVFASIPGHYAWTLDDPLWRVLALRGIAWAAGRDDGMLMGAMDREAEIAK